MRVERIKLMMRSAAVGGERRLDVVEFIAIARALDAARSN
jgi:hypothetical protein